MNAQTLSVTSVHRLHRKTVLKEFGSGCLLLLFSISAFASGSSIPTRVTIWPNSAVPGRVDNGPRSPVELGVKFKSDVAGTITGIRFYKAKANTGTHVGNLWTTNGMLLATVTFSNETASGWQEALFAMPVAITSNTVYVASYHANEGHYSKDDYYFLAKGANNPPLHALTNGVSGGNGVYAYGASSTFPNQTYNAANYWVDVVFQAVPITLTSIAIMPANPSIFIGAAQQFTAIGTYSDGSTRDITRQTTWTSSSARVATINTNGLATGVSIGATTISAALTGVTGSAVLNIRLAPLIIAKTSLPGYVMNMAYTGTLTSINGTLPYTWSIADGSLPLGLTLNAASGVITGMPSEMGTFSFIAQVMDSGSPAQMVTMSLSITITSTSMPAVVTIWSNTAAPTVVDAGPASAIELGVKFRSDVTGTIAGIRFYKADANTGAHVGNLWTSDGTLLATVTFSNETVSGWQEAFFATPVTIASNTVYVASYHATNGHYSADVNYFSGQGVDNPPLHALADGMAGGNGVYAYGSSSAFPTQTLNAANYWVDVIFDFVPPTLTSIELMPATPNIIPGVSQQFTAIGTYSDGSTRDITSQATWTSSSAGVATLNTSGLATGVSAGATTISAALAGMTASTVLTVQSAPLFITTTPLTNGVVNRPYIATLTANGGTLPYTWSIVDGFLPSGLTLNAASGAITGMPTTTGTVSFTAQVRDAGSPAQITNKTLSISITPLPAAVTIWPSTAVPSLVDVGQDSALELGVKFRSDATGSIAGIRFYKATANGGTHMGNLWTSNGILLATATFTNETEWGWQQTYFATPVAIASDTVYVASYHANNGHYSADLNYFSGKGADNPPLHALANGVSGGNGVYAYGANSAFPTQAYNAVNYWVDVMFRPGPLPTVTSLVVTPTNLSIIPGVSTQFTATGTFSDGSTRDLTSQAIWTSSDTGVATIDAGGLAIGVSAGLTTISVALADVTNSTALTVQSAPLAITTTSLPNGVVNMAYAATLTANGGTLPYTWSIVGGSLPVGLTLNTADGAITGIPTTAGAVSFTAHVKDASNPIQIVTKSLSIKITPASPILVVTNTANPFSQYYAELLLTEGLNEFDLKDISFVSNETLVPYDVVILGQVALQPSQVSIVSNWVNAGGNLIAMRPDKKLAGLFGLVDTGATLANGYLLVDTSTGPGAGIVGETIQFHGTADCYTVASETHIVSLATLYSNVQTATLHPAVTLRSVGSNGGQAAAFTYDLARSIVYTRQGNPAWAGQARDGLLPVRSDDLFYGAATNDMQPDWIDLTNNKVAIPQADEQQRLLANLILTMNSDKNLLPRFWYFPHGYEALVVMTGDDHGGANGNIASRCDQYIGLSPTNGSVDDWETIRNVSYIFTNACLINGDAARYKSCGFEIGLHLNTLCANYTRESLHVYFAEQLALFSATYPSLPPPKTLRAHCIPWSGYTTMPEVEVLYGIRMDLNYYYYPTNWVADRPGFFTGSGMPMRFATATGDVIDVYQAATEMTDESGQSYPYTVDSLLDRALGPEGYYGAFVANAHTDDASLPESDEIVWSAKDREVPVVSACQLLTWLDARNASSLQSIRWNDNRQTFSVNADTNARGLLAMAPIPLHYSVSAVKYNGYPNPIGYYLRGVKGFQYAMFPVTNGDYEVSYELDTNSPSITKIVPAQGQLEVDLHTKVSVTFSEAMNASTINTNTIILRDSLNHPVAATVSYNASSFTAVLTPSGSLALLTNYTAVVKGNTGGVTDLVGNPRASDFVWAFTTDDGFSIWPDTAVPRKVDDGEDGYALELGVKFQSDVAGTISGIRFYKAAANTGIHIGNLWTSNGTWLAAATFTNETASGWQKALFATPVAIASNTVYVASYHADNGHYSADRNCFLRKGVDNPPLHALANGVSSNGVFAYGWSSTFPNQSWSAVNYWVDVVFQAGISTTLTSLVVTPANPNILTGASQQFTATRTYSDGSVEDITSQATWASSIAGVATINTSGLAIGVSTGATTISATLAGVMGSTVLSVQSAPLVITTTSLTNGVVNMAYTGTLTAIHGTLPYTWSIADGSFPSGLTLNPSNGAITGSPSAAGIFYFTAQVRDSSSPSQTATKPLSMTITPTSMPTVVTIWPSTTAPEVVDGGPDNAAQLGVKFRSDITGTIAGIRFYKADANTGVHVGNLWTSDGTLLATVTFSNETASGWQQVLFATPVAIASNTVYVASYHANNGHYSVDFNYFSGQGVDNPPLHALADGVAGGNGVYAYGASSVFPTQTYNAANYWVDVVFQAGSAPTLTSIGITPTNSTILTGGSQQFTATGTYSDGSTRDITSQATWTSSNTAVATINAAGLATGVFEGTTMISATLAGVTGSTALTVQSAPLVITTTSLSTGIVSIAYTATLMAGGGTPTYTWSIISGILPSGLMFNTNSGAISGTPRATGTFDFTVQVSDAGNHTATKTLSIAITPLPTVVTIWPSTAAPERVDDGPDSAVELGVKFQSDVAGTITGIRFYKSATNTGAHVGNLWTSDGTLLATVTFSNETASGWQQVLFATPVAIASNTVYVASYHANNGHYSEDDYYFQGRGVDNPPLHAPANGVADGNGVYAYGSSSTFPNQTWNAANYWVDVVFQPASPPPLTSIPLMAAGENVERWPWVWTSGDLSKECGASNLIDGDTNTMWIGSAGGEPWRVILDLGVVTDVTGIQLMFQDMAWTNQEIIGSRDREVWFNYLAETNEWVPLRYLYVNFWGDKPGAQPPAIREIIWRDR